VGAPRGAPAAIPGSSLPLGNEAGDREGALREAVGATEERGGGDARDPWATLALGGNRHCGRRRAVPMDTKMARYTHSNMYG